MAIVNMASAMEKVPAGAVNVRDATEHWKHYSSDPKFTMILYDTYTGLCVKEREANFHDDSDFYMTVYEPETDSFKEVEFATTRGWCYPCLASKVDAPPEIMAKYEAHRDKLRAEAAAAAAEREHKTPAKGKTLRVVRGRKVPVGTLGTCIWCGAGRFGKRVGIKTESGEVHWTAMSNVEVAA